jgi:hypothetical protein
MNRFLKSIIAASLFSMGMGMMLPNCTPKIDSDAYLQREANELQRRTLRPHSRLADQNPLTLQGLGAIAGWEFESNYDPDAYNRWVTTRLRPDFQVRETAYPGLRFSKYARGDVETLSVETVSSSGTLHVTVKRESNRGCAQDESWTLPHEGSYRKKPWG